MAWEDRAYNRDNSGGIPPVRFQFPPLSPLTIALLIVNGVLFLLKVVPPVESQVVKFGALNFDQDRWWQIWRWISYQYLHGGGAHIFFNMLGVYFFLPALELRWGWKKALGFYTLGGIAAGLVFFLMVSATGRWGSSLIGASGSVLACLGAVALLYPERQLIFFLFSLPIRIAAALLAILYLLTVVADQDFSNAAHLGGLAFGFLAPWLIGPKLAEQQHKWRKHRQQREAQSEINEQQQVDRILAKVADKGMHSLSSAEKKALARATENQRVRDEKRAKRGMTY